VVEICRWLGFAFLVVHYLPGGVHALHGKTFFDVRPLPNYFFHWVRSSSKKPAGSLGSSFRRRWLVRLLFF
jgi:hypothetical protein